MSDSTAAHDGMTLFTGSGERKYLNAAERKRYFEALPVINEPCERTFCETLFWTGCRPSEALALDFMRVNVEDCFLVFQTLKKRGANKGRSFRIVPVPRSFMTRLNRIHGILDVQMSKGANLLARLWSFGRQKGWRLVGEVMHRARIFGIRACARGLRHSFGVHAILCGVPETKLQRWMGHSSLRITGIYLNLIGPEDRAIATRMWRQEAYAAHLAQ